eukprot:jgi/Chlat1/12/ChrspC224973S00733
MWRGWHRANRQTLSWYAWLSSPLAGRRLLRAGRQAPQISSMATRASRQITTRDCKELAVCVGRKS